MIGSRSDYPNFKFGLIYKKIKILTNQSRSNNHIYVEILECVKLMTVNSKLNFNIFFCFNSKYDLIIKIYNINPNTSLPKKRHHYQKKNPNTFFWQEYKSKCC